MNFVVCTSEFDANSGGVVCLHALSDCLAELGHSVFLAPLINEIGWDFFSPVESMREVTRLYRAGMRKPRASPYGRANPVNIFKARQLAKDGAFFVYPELILGNPYGASKVIRWLLHYPMYHSRAINWSVGDWVIRFNDAIPKLVLPGVNFMGGTLKVVRYPVEVYSSKKRTKRSGSAYLIRKGANKSPIHPPNAICIDGLTHEEAAEVLGGVEKFYSYDVYTAYSYLAVVAGTLSIVVPDPDRSLEEWYPSVEDRWGLAYGEDMAEWALSTAHLVPGRLRSEEVKCLENVRAFVSYLVERTE